MRRSQLEHSRPVRRHARGERAGCGREAAEDAQGLAPGRLVECGACCDGCESVSKGAYKFCECKGPSPGPSPPPRTPPFLPRLTCPPPGAVAPACSWWGPGSCFEILVRHQLDNPTSPGLSLRDWFDKCRMTWCASNETNLKAFIREYTDHRMLTTKRGAGGVECHFCSLSKEVMLRLAAPETAAA